MPQSTLELSLQTCVHRRRIVEALPRRRQHSLVAVCSLSRRTVQELVQEMSRKHTCGRRGNAVRRSISSRSVTVERRGYAMQPIISHLGGPTLSSRCLLRSASK